ncbi:PaaI family thioesterase [Corynebacterium bouchesdurhonense]|uniref:PaaI family thioesterase n=1 Tax=Corynebacterium bouchesdurhonense TaxID=1720192 RepID=UPI000829DFB6|nr:PaaI family thioesterase [Corynebacterium bouchesdurhonense]
MEHFTGTEAVGRLFHDVIDPPMDERELAAVNAAGTDFAQRLGLELTHCSSVKVEGFLDVGAEHLQPAGIVNGGVYAAIGESLGSIAAVARAAKPAVGMSNYTDLLGSVREGQRIEATALPVHTGRSTHLWRVDMRCGERLVAVTNLKLMILDG